jgi:hypothetical protein
MTPNGANSTDQKVCFVIMGYGEKTDFKTGRVLDLDKTYRTIIKKAVEAAGLQCVRADEIRHSGVIDVPMYEQLLMADVVVADLSTSNSNAIYELGVRHALRPYTTITIAEKEMQYPVDLNHIAIRRYEHLGRHIDAEEADRMKTELTGAIQTILATPKPDSPIYTYIANLAPPEIRAVAKSVAAAAPKAAPAAGGERIAFLMEEAKEALKSEDWPGAKRMFARIRELRKDPNGQLPEDPYIIQQLALATYKSKQPDAVTALHEAKDLLLTLHPETTHDPETLGLLGAVWKRLYEANPNDRSALENAIASYEHGFHVKNDYYNGINLAYLLNVRASVSTGEDAVADRVLANRVRRQVLAICEKTDPAKLTDDKERYWVAATVEEAWFGLGDQAAYERARSQAEKIAPETWMRGTTEEQLGKLAALL